MFRADRHDGQGNSQLRGNGTDISVSLGSSMMRYAKAFGLMVVEMQASREKLGEWTVPRPLAAHHNRATVDTLGSSVLESRLPAGNYKPALVHYSESQI